MTSLRIALRYLFSRKTHQAVNVISFISMAGVAVTTMAAVCVLSVFNGFETLAMGKLAMLSADLRIENASGAKLIDHVDELTAQLMTLPEVALVAPTVEEQALASYGPTRQAIRLKGVTPDFCRITALDSLIIDGQATVADSSLNHFATLSVGTALQLEARPDFSEPLLLWMPRRVGRINPAIAASAFRGDTLLVGGVYQSEQAEFDTDMVMVSIDVARHLLDLTPSQATALELRLSPGADPDRARRKVAAIVGSNFRVKTTMEQHETSFKMIAIEKWITFAMLAFILLIASFNVVSTLTMLIIEKAPNIATLQALGASRAMTRRIFMTEGWLIAVGGGVAGIILGVAVCLAQQWGGFISIGGNHDAMSITTYPVELQPADLGAVAAIVAAIGLLAAATARKSA